LGGGTNDPCSETKPDLTTSAPTPSTAIVGIAKTFSTTITNSDAPTGASFSNFFQIATNTADAATYTDKTSTTMTARATNTTGTATVSHTFTAEGTYYIRACADKTNRSNAGVIAESNESNNCGPWTTVEANNQYTLTYNGNGNTGGAVVADALSPYISGSLVTTKTKGTLVKTNSVFAGWNTAAN